MTMSITIDFVQSCRDIDQELWKSCFQPPLEGFFWYETLERCGIEDQFKFNYAVIKDGQRPIGIAPCFVHDVPMSLVVPPNLVGYLEALARVFPAAGYQRTLFIGSPCADEGTIGLVDGVELQDVIAPLTVAMQKQARRLKAPMIVFKDFPETLEGGFAPILQKSGFFRMVSYPGAVLKLVGKKTDDYIASMQRGHRYNFKKKLRQSRELLDLDTQFVQRPDDAVLDEVFGLFMQTYEKGKTKFERLSVQFFRQIREAEPAWFILQRDKKSGKLLTFMLVFTLGKRLINKFIGLDYESGGGKTFLYFRQFEAALDFAYINNCAELQSGQTGYSAKLDLGHELVSLVNICRHSNLLINYIYAAVAKDVNWATLDQDLAHRFNQLEKAGTGDGGNLASAGV